MTKEDKEETTGIAAMANAIVARTMILTIHGSMHVLHSFSARCALVKLWRTTSEHRVLNVRSTNTTNKVHKLTSLLFCT